jgi:hypothetical protein
MWFRKGGGGLKLDTWRYWQTIDVLPEQKIRSVYDIWSASFLVSANLLNC